MPTPTCALQEMRGIAQRVHAALAAACEAERGALLKRRQPAAHLLGGGWGYSHENTAAGLAEVFDCGGGRDYALTVPASTVTVPASAVTWKRAARDAEHARAPLRTLLRGSYTAGVSEGGAEVFEDADVRVVLPPSAVATKPADGLMQELVAVNFGALAKQADALASALRNHAASLPPSPSSAPDGGH
jgi:hypothetical protein